MTLNRKIMDVITGSFVMDETPLTTYHATQDVKKALLARDAVTRCQRVKTALKNWRVMVSYCSNGQTRVFRPDTKQEIFLGVDLWSKHLS